MKKYNLALSENGWEYSGNIEVICETLEQLDRNTINVNGAVIKFDEEIIIESEE